LSSEHNEDIIGYILRISQKYHVTSRLNSVNIYISTFHVAFLTLPTWLLRYSKQNFLTSFCYKLRINVWHYGWLT
jgi:hypothetical protein